MKTAIIIPTYNESDNIRDLVTQLLALPAAADVIVVDDNSPDGTGRIADELKGQDSRVHVIHREKKEPFGLLRVGAPVEFGIHCLPRMFASFRKEHRGVGFDLQLGHPSEILPRLEQGELDIAFADMFSEHPTQRREYAIFGIEHVMNEELVLVCSATSLWALWG